MDIEMLKTVIGKAAQADLTEKLIIVAVVWRVMAKRVADHFANLEKSVSELKTVIADAAKTLGSRLDSAESRIAKLETERKSIHGRHGH